MRQIHLHPKAVEFSQHGRSSGPLSLAAQTPSALEMLADANFSVDVRDS